MTVSTVKARIAAICETITGVTSAYAGGPRAISDADLPAIVVLTGAAQKEDTSADMLTVNRTYQLALLALPWAEGIELEAEEKCEPFFERIEDAFFTRPSLQLADNTTRLAEVQLVQTGPDTGVIDISLAGAAYAGVIFDISVQTIRVITNRGT